jgi:hypothetical protein
MEGKLMAKISDLLGSISRTNPVYVEYNTNCVKKSISAPGKDTWFDLPEVTITIPEDGLYLLNANIRFWQDKNTDYKWKKHRILVNGNEDTKLNWFGINTSTESSYLDSSHSLSIYYRFNKDVVLKVQGYIGSNQSGDVHYSDGNGSSSILAYKIGE